MAAVRPDFTSRNTDEAESVEKQNGKNRPSKNSEKSTSEMDKEWTRWVNLSVDWDDFLCRQYNISMEELKVHIPVIERVASWDMSEHVDLLQWFKKNRKDFPLISRVAARCLSSPESNAHQERVFSHAKRVNDPLRRSMGGDVFEMNVFALVNQDQRPELPISLRMRRPKGRDVDPELGAKLVLIS